MNTRIFTRAKSCIKTGVRALALVCAMAVLLPPIALADWKVDLSRRQKVMRDQELRADRPTTAEPEKNFFDVLFEAGEPMQEIVILNTDKGFLPGTVRMRKGGKYLLHVVNVNEREKNVSFVLDAFSEHHATFYGKVKSFRVEPKKDGIFSYQCPETSAEGRVVVYNPQGSGAPQPIVRAPATDEGK